MKNIVILTGAELRHTYFKRIISADKNINTINPIKRIFAAIKYLVFGTSLDEI